MSFCSIPKSLGALGTTGELSAAGADGRAAHVGGLDNPKNQLSMGAAVVAAVATAFQMEKSPSFLRGLGIGLAPAAAVAQVARSWASLESANTAADKLAGA